jgi:hypothetical protein
MNWARKGGSMIKYVLPAAVAALALGAPSAVHAQMARPIWQVKPIGALNANATIIGQPQSDADDGDGYGMPVPIPYMPPVMPAVSPRTTWIPGHYNWDPNTSNYVWTDGQYIEAPRENALWVPGHWQETAASWIWIDGRWN